MRALLPVVVLLLLAGAAPAANGAGPAATGAGVNAVEGASDAALGDLASLDLELAQAPGMWDLRDSPPPLQGLEQRPVWLPYQTLMQGFFGANLLETVERSGGNLPPLDGSGDELAQLPAVGGGAQWKLGGERLDFGLELMIAFSGRADAVAFATGGGGAVLAVDVDMFLVDLYGGPFLSVFLGNRWRVYGALGPVMQWASLDENASSYSSNTTGFGTGVYGRTGVELRVRPGLMIGGGVRWTDTTIDLGSGNGELGIDGYQWAVTVTTGI